MASKGTLLHPIIVSQLNDKKLKYSAITPLSKLIEEAKKPKADPEAIYKVRFFVAAIPEDASKFVKYYDAKKGESKDATSKTTIKAKHENLILNMPLLVKDQSTMLSNHFHKINVVVQQPGDCKSLDGFFRDITPEKIIKDKDAQNAVNESLKLLQRFNVWLEATVKVNGDGVILITNHTQLKEF